VVLLKVGLYGVYSSIHLALIRYVAYAFISDEYSVYFPIVLMDTQHLLQVNFEILNYSYYKLRSDIL
jgi:hypothetical protein